MGIMAYLGFKAGYWEREARRMPPQDTTERDKKKTLFHAVYDAQIEQFLSAHPNVVSWGADSLEESLLILKDKKEQKMMFGKFILDENGEIDRWEAETRNISLKRENMTLNEAMLTTQITGILKDNENTARYCEQVSATLLEEGECVFDAPYSLHMKKKEFAERYGTNDWQNAWENALKDVFQAKEVCKKEKAIGCFRMQAK